MNKKIIMPQFVTKQPSDIFLMLFLFSFFDESFVIKNLKNFLNSCCQLL